MSTGHTHQGGPHMTQNQGNVLGDRPCVRQSRLYREHVGGNEMKGILGQDNLKWDTQRTQGAYEGGRVYDAEPNQRQQQQQQLAQPYGAAAAPQQYGEQQRQQYGSFPQQQQQQPLTENYQRGVPAAEGQRQGGGVCWQQGPPPSAEEQQQLSGGNHRRGAGVANRTTYNIFTGE